MPTQNFAEFYLSHGILKLEQYKAFRFIEGMIYGDEATLRKIDKKRHYEAWLRLADPDGIKMVQHLADDLGYTDAAKKMRIHAMKAKELLIEALDKFIEISSSADARNP